jgi:hypothetical protein
MSGIQSPISSPTLVNEGIIAGASRNPAILWGKSLRFAADLSAASLQARQINRLLLDHIRDHAGGRPRFPTPCRSLDDRELNYRDKEIFRVTIHTALQKIEKRGTFERIASEGSRNVFLNAPR